MVRRRVYSISGWGIGALAVAVVGLFALAFVLRRPPALTRTTVVLVGDPIVVWSKDRRSGRVVRLRLSNDTAIEAVHGYGIYTLDSLWKLGAMEKKDGAVLSQSLEDALGIPIRWFIGPKGNGEIEISPKSVLTYLTGGYRTNISLPMLISLIRDVLQTGSDEVEEQSLDAARTDQTLPDGSTRHLLDMSRVDVLLGNLFEDEQIRQEGRSVAVYNTTDMPSLGNRAARLLGRIGVFVVRVGNGTPVVGACIITADKHVLGMATVLLMQEVFGCQAHEGDTEVADIELRVGVEYQATFLPQE